MSTSLLALIIALAAVGLWYIAGTIWIIYKKQVDPTLLTHFTPLNKRNYLLSRLLMGLNIVLLLAGRHYLLLILLIPAFLFSLAIAQIVLLVIFGRTGTQPLAYYLLLGLGGILPLLFQTSLLCLALLIITLLAQEVVLRRWLKNMTKHYNEWVAAKVMRLHKRYRHLSTALTHKEWFYTLHFAVTESIARPKLSRLIERLYFQIKHPKTISTGIMQVSSDRVLSDNDSMKLGSQIVCEVLQRLPADLAEPTDQLRWLARAYNGSLNDKANDDYTSYLLATYPGLVAAWERIS